MKKVLTVLTAVLLAAAVVGAQQIDVEQVDPADIDFSQVDLSGVEFYFHGPLELYVTGVEYGGTVYAAVLDYDGGQTIDIRAPRVASTAGKPIAVDLSEIAVSLRESGLEIEGVIADGRFYSGVLRVTNDNDLRVARVFSGERVEAPMAEVESLEEEVDRLNRVIERRDARIERLNEQIEELPEEERVTRLRNQLRDLEDDLQQSQRRVDNLQQTVSQRESEIDELESTIDRGRNQIASLEQDLDRRESQIEDLEDQIADLEDELDERDDQIAFMQERLEDLRVGDWETAAQRLDRTLQNGFRGGRVGTGSWQTSSVAVTQNDAEALFAKYIVPVRQGRGELYYRFTGRSLGTGRQGYGLHFLADGAETAGGYGYGDSYLVWITRDVGNYQNDSTYVQLYRSYGDTRMVEVQSSVSDISIGSSTIVEVHVNRSRDLITVIVDDERVLAYQPEQLILSGSEVVARTMGRAVIRDLQVRTGR